MPRRVSRRAAELLSGALRPVTRSKTVLPTPPAPPQYKPEEREYARGLLSLIAPQEQVIHRLLLPHLPLLLERDFVGDGPMEDMEAIFVRIRLRFAALLSEEQIAGTVRRTTNSVNIKNKDYYARTIKAIIGIDYTAFEPWLQTTISEFTAENIALIKTIPEQSLDQIETVVREAVQKGKRTDVVAREIENRMRISRGRARTIARDQVNKFGASLNRERQMQAGVNEYEWIDSKDSKVRHSHARRDGHTFKWDQPIQPQLIAKGLPVDDIDGHPGQPINCRCVPRPKLVRSVDVANQ